VCPFARLYGDRWRLVMRSPDDTTQNSAIGVNQCEFLYHPGKRTSSHNMIINGFFKSINSAPGSSFGYGRPDSVKRYRHLKTHRPVCTSAVRNKGLKKSMMDVYPCRSGCARLGCRRAQNSTQSAIGAAVTDPRRQQHVKCFPVSARNPRRVT
jgi:hypothetical protein